MKFSMWLAAAGVVASGVFAQGDAGRFLPADSTIVIECDAPARLSEAFAATNMGQMIASEEAAEVWREFEAAFLEEMEEMPPDAAATYALLEEVFEGYTGRLVFGVSLDFSAVENLETDEPKVVAAFVLTPDGETDFEAAIELFQEQVQERNDDEPIESRTIGNGDTVEVVAVDTDVSIMLPILLDDHLVIAAGELDGYLASLGDREGEELSAGRGGIAVSIDGGICDDLVEALKGSTDFETQLGASIIEDMIGGMKDITLDVRPAGQFIDMQMVVHHDPDATNMLDMIEPARPGQVDLIDLAPREGASFSAMTVNLDYLIELFGSMANAMGQDPDALEDGFAEMFGIELRADILDRFNGNVLFQTAMGEDPDDVSIVTTFGLNGGDALEATVEKMLRDNGLHAARKTKDYQGLKIREMSVMGMFPITWVFADNLLVFGFGFDAGRPVRAIVDAHVDRKNGVDAPKWPDGVRARLAKLGQDWQWMSVADNGGEMKGLVDSLEADMEMYDLDDPLLTTMVDFFGLIDRYDLLNYVTTTTFEKGRMISRAIW